MRKLKLPGFGSLGAEIVDVDLATASEDEILQMGFDHLHDLITLVRKKHVGGISLERFHQICASWAIALPGGAYQVWAGNERLQERYGNAWWEKRDAMAEEDRNLLDEAQRMTQGIEHLLGMVRVTGIRDDHGNHTGMFADGELEWHSNQQGTNEFLPVVGLLAWEGSGGSRTEFVNTVDAYNALSPSWQKTCDELIAVHRWEENAVAPGLNALQDEILKMNLCPVDGAEVPLIAHSPWGYKGLHFPFTSISHFKDMSKEESKKVVAYLKDHIFQDKFIYGHDWEDGDLMFFDNTVTLHRRPTKDCSKRLMYRMCFNYDRLLQLQPEPQNHPLTP